MTASRCISLVIVALAIAPAALAQDAGTVRSAPDAPRRGVPESADSGPAKQPATTTPSLGDEADKPSPSEQRPPRPSERQRTEPRTPPPPEPEAPEPEPPETTGDAPELEAGEGEPEEPAAGHAASYHEQPSPLVFRVPARGRSPETRARSATQALTAALDDSGEGDEPAREPEIVVEDNQAIVRIGDHIITRLYPEDAQAEGMPLDRYAVYVEQRLEAFTQAQLQRKAFQLFFLHLFLSVLFGVIGFLTLRGLRNAFDRWDAELDERRGSFKPISVLRIPVFSGEAFASALAFGLAVGRVTAYVATAIATVVAVLSQFETTRPLLRRIVSWSAGPIVNGVEAVVTAIPGLILAAILVVGLRAALRVLNILLDGVASKRLTWQRVPPERVPVFRFSATVGAVVLAAPLLVAAAFGRWGTPLETLALSGGIAVVVAGIPLVSSYIVGVFTLWRSVMREGDWVQIGQVSGEVTRLSFAELHLVPESGGTIAVPMIYLLFHPLRRLRQSPEVSFEITVARDRSAKDLIAALKKAVIAVESDAKVELTDLCRAWIKARISAPAVREGVRQQLMMAVSDAVDRHEFELPTLHGPDR